MAEDQNGDRHSEDAAASADAFDAYVDYFAKELTIDAHDLSETYKDKHKSLKVLFEEAHSARTSVAPPLIVSVLLCGIAAAIDPALLWGAVPLTALASYFMGKSDGSGSQKVADIVRTEVGNYRHNNGTPKLPALN